MLHFLRPEGATLRAFDCRHLLRRRALAVADATTAAESKTESLSNSSDIKHLGDNGVGVYLQHHTRTSVSSQNPLPSEQKTVSLSECHKGASAENNKQEAGKAYLVIHVKIWHICGLGGTAYC